MGPYIAPVTVAPASEPMTLDEARAYAKIDHDCEDSTVSRLIKVAREYIENTHSIAIMSQTRQLHLDGFPPSDRIIIPYPPFSSLTTFTYRDSSEVDHTVSASSYAISSARQPAVLYLKDGYDWPDEELSTIDAVKLTYVCGYSSASLVPSNIIQAMHLAIGHFYEHREEVVLGSVVGVKSARVAMGIRALLMPYRYSSFA